MKKFWVLIATLLIPLTLSPAANAVQEVVISEPTHRLSDGVFFDDAAMPRVADRHTLARVAPACEYSDGFVSAAAAAATSP